MGCHRVGGVNVLVMVMRDERVTTTTTTKKATTKATVALGRWSHRRGPVEIILNAA